MKRRGISIICMLAFLLPAAAWAQQKGAIDLKSTAEVEVVGQTAKGEKKVTRVEASQANVAPGDIVIFTVHYVNRGNKPAENVLIKNPVPEHMLYVAGSAEGKDSKLEFSADNGKTFGPASKLMVKDTDGKERLAGAADYTMIRWTLQKPVAKGAKGSVSFRAKVK